MRIFGLEITRTKQAFSAVPQRGWRNLIFEPYAGAWQNNDELKRDTLLCYPTLYACMNRISQDIGKLPFDLRMKDSNGIWKPVENPAYSPVLRKPNHYQTAQQFRESWILSKLISGNTYVLKRRDARGVVDALYVLDPCRVVPLVSESGDVFYQLYSDSLPAIVAGSPDGKSVTVPAREIIHDRMNTFHHQLIGVPPLCAAYWPAVKNLRILRNSAEFFGNGARPGGILTAPQGITDDEASTLKSYWDTNFTGDNTGKIAVLGADLKYQQLAENSADSQLVEQMKYSDEQICQPFGIPPFKVGIGMIPAGLGVDAINLLYHEDALSGHVEAMENLLDEALALPSQLGIWLDTDPLFRMDLGKQADVEVKLVGGKIKTPDEARHRLGLSPTGGGDTLWGQHQDHPLGMLAERNDMPLIGQEPVAPQAPVQDEPDPEAVEEARSVATMAVAHAIRKAIHARIAADAD